MPYLKMLRGPEPGRKIALEAPEMTIGRGRTNDIIIQDNEVSRVHCRLVRVLDDYEIHDLQSTNSTYVNGQKIEAGGWLLSANAIVELGDSITFEYIPSDVSASTRIPAAEPQTREKPYIIIKQASLPQPEIYRLERPSISIGRDVDNDIILQEAEVSRHHLRLALTKDGYAIEDLNTMNGTWVNDRRLQEQRLLKMTDVIRIGTRVRMWYTNDPDRLLESLRSGSEILHVPTDETRQSRQPEDQKRKTSTVPSIRNQVPIEEQQTSLMATSELEHAVYIAYERDDSAAITEELVKYLKVQNVPLWVDQKLNPNTKAWQDAIEQAQLTCPILLAVISGKALETPHIQRGLRHFMGREKPILLLQVEAVQQTPMALQNVKTIYYDPHNPMASFHDVYTALRELYQSL
jgi:pSer/pThr/pTyr-binding forkhead associated (FHA) protein